MGTPTRMKSRSFLVSAVLAGLALSGCNESSINDFAPNPNKPLPASLVQKIKAKGMSVGAPIMMRIIKDEHLLEIWKQKPNGRYDLVTAYNICAWSGKLGQKKKQGDRQAPEGFYTIRPAQLNPKSKYFLAFDTGFPNAYDRSHGYSGSNLMVHGACSSSGCYSMTDASVQEIFAFARDALKGGQDGFVLQALPFRMTAEKMAYYAGDPNYPFWQMIKEGYDHFELTRQVPKVDFCEKKYVFNRSAVNGGTFNASSACPPSEMPAALASAEAAYQLKYDTAFAVARKKYESLPVPIVMGGKSRALDKKWKPTPVAMPSTMAFAAAAPRVTAPMMSQAPVKDAPGSASAPETPDQTLQGPAVLAAAATAAASPKKPDAANSKEPVSLAAEEDAANVQVPEANPNAAAPIEQAAPAAPAKKKRWWLLGN
jgi:murein L,D-transpeptidase YafK